MENMKAKEKCLEELTEMIRGHQNVLTDPMNGCPEDFAEDYAPIEVRKCMETELAGATFEEIAAAIAKGRALAAEDYQEMFGQFMEEPNS